MPVVGDLDAVSSVVRADGYRIVAVAPAPGWGPARLHRLAWELEGTRTELAVDPGLMEIAGPRLHITPVDGLPLLRLSKPRFTGATRLLKNVFDRSAAALLLVLVAPLLAGIAVAVRLDGGPALYFQERVGVGGRTFRMVKFRSMVADADRMTAGTRRRQRGRRAIVQDAPRPPHHAGGGDPAPVLPRRAPPTVQRAHRLHVARRAPAAAPARGHQLRPASAAAAPGAARNDRALAGQRPQRPVVGGDGAARPPLRGELVDRRGRHDPLEDRRRDGPRARRVLGPCARTGPSGLPVAAGGSVTARSGAAR